MKHSFKIFFLLIAIFPILLPVSLHAEDYFEGVLTFTMGTAGKNTDMKYFMKGSKMRMEIEIAPGINSIGIADYEKKKIYSLLGPSKLYTETDVNEESVSNKTDKALNNTQFTETGESTEILGYKCDKLVSKKGSEINEIWIAKGFGKFYQPDLGGGSAPFVALKAKFEKEKAFPFRIVTFSSDKKELFKMEVTAVEKKALEDELFKIPEGYSRISERAPVSKQPLAVKGN